MDITALLSALAARHAPDYDAARGLLRYRMRTNPHCAAFQDLPDLFATRESLYFAHILLRLSPSAAPDPRALRIIDEILAAQCADGGERDGLWHYYAGHDVNAWPVPDPNWADFNAMSLLLVLHFEGARLSAELRARILAAIHRAARFVMRRNVAVGYTNIALKGALVTFAAAEHTGDAELLAYARERVEKIHRKIAADGRITEYLSPTYAGVSLAALAAFAALVADAPARALMREVEHIFWRHILSRWHAPSGLLAGPHSRAYEPGLGESRATLGLLLAKLAGPRTLRLESRPFPDPLSSVMATVLGPDAPAADLAAALDPARRADLSDPAYVERDGLLVAYTTHLEPAFCLGSVNRHDGWGQRQNLLAYWPAAAGDFGRLGYRTASDGHAFVSGVVHAAQAGARIVFGTTIAPGRDTHPYIPVASLRSARLGGELFWEQPDRALRVRLAGHDIPPDTDTPLAVGELVELVTPGHTVRLRLLALASPLAAALVARLRWDGAHGHLWFPWHEGESTAFTWPELAGARLAATVEIVADPAAPEPRPAVLDASAAPDGAAWRISWAGLELNLPRSLDLFP